ncbi:MAG: virginiamycin B lyase family protein, partial [Ktedonobacterales bacterium]
FVVYVVTPHATEAQQSHAHPYYLAGLIGLAVAEACQLLGILVLIGHWASHFNTERRFREIFILLVSLVPYVVIVVFACVLITYLRARRQDPTSERTRQAKQELKEQTVDTLIDQSSTRGSALANSPAPAPPRSLAASASVARPPHPPRPPRPTMRDAVRRVVGPSTQRSVSDAGGRLAVLTMSAVLLATIATLGAISPLNRVTSNPAPGARAGAHATPTATATPGNPPTLAPGATQEFSVPTANSGPAGLTMGPDGNLWFTESTGNQIGRMTPNGAVSEFPIPTSASSPDAITTGPDGNLWFTESFGNKIGRITPSGVITEFPIPAAQSRPAGITAGSDGNIWFAESGAGQIGRITPGGTIQ